MAITEEYLLFELILQNTSRVLKSVTSAALATTLTRQIHPKKHSFWVINEHFEGEFNDARASAIVFNTLLVEYITDYQKREYRIRLSQLC